MPTDEHLGSPHLRRLSLSSGERSIEAAGGASVYATSGPSVHVYILEPSTRDSEQVATVTSTRDSDYSVVTIRYMVPNTAEDSPATTTDSTTSLRPALSLVLAKRPAREFPLVADYMEHKVRRMELSGAGETASKDCPLPSTHSPLFSDRLRVD
jgi:hypothetical protein